MPGRPPKPIAIHKLQGTFQPVRHAHREHEPYAEGELADTRVPHWMLKRQKRLWREAIATAPRGVLRQADRHTFIGYILAVDTMIEAAKAQNRAQLLQPNGMPSPYLRMIRQTLEMMSKLANDLGFSPAARIRLATGEPPPPEQPKGFEMVTPRRLA